MFHSSSLDHSALLISYSSSYPSPGGGGGFLPPDEDSGDLLGPLPGGPGGSIGRAFRVEPGAAALAAALSCLRELASSLALFAGAGAAVDPDASTPTPTLAAEPPDSASVNALVLVSYSEAPPRPPLALRSFVSSCSCCS